MSGQWSYEIPYPPTVNHYWLSKGKRRFISSAGKSFLEGFRISVGDKAPGLICRVAVALDLFPPDRRKRDIDNTVKSVLDGLKKSHVILDDEQVDLLLVRRQKCAPPDGGAIVYIQDITDCIFPMFDDLDREGVGVQ